jgi:hypothetical protein
MLVLECCSLRTRVLVTDVKVALAHSISHHEPYHFQSKHDALSVCASQA